MVFQADRNFILQRRLLSGKYVYIKMREIRYNFRFGRRSDGYGRRGAVAAYLTEELRMSRPKAVVGVLVTILVTGSLCALSQRPGSSLHIGSMNLFDLCDYLSSNVLMPLGGLLIVIFTGWVFSPEKLRNELTNNLTVNQWCYPAIRLLIRFVVPVVITLLFLTQIGIL